jgi:hypothetical protein
LRLEYRQPALERELFDSTGSRTQAAAGGPVRLRQYQLDIVAGR